MRRKTSYVRTTPLETRVKHNYNVEYLDFPQQKSPAYYEDLLATLKSANSVTKSFVLLLIAIFCLSALTITAIEDHIRDTHNKLNIATINNDRLEFKKSSTKSLYNILTRVRHTTTLNKPVDIIVVKSKPTSTSHPVSNKVYYTESVPQGY